MANPGLIDGGRMSRGERSGDRRNLSDDLPAKRSTLLRLWRYMGAQRAMLLVALGLTIASSVLALLGPKLSGLAINAIGQGPGEADFSRVFWYAGWMVGCYLVSGLLSYLLTVVMNAISRKVVYQMRRDVFNRLTRLPVGFFDRYQAGDLLSVITYDISTVNQSLTTDLIQVIKSVATVSVSLGMMLTIAPVLTSVFVVTVPFTVWFTRRFSRISRPKFKRRSAKLGDLNGYVEEMMNGQKTTRAYGAEAAVDAGFDRKNAQAVEAYTQSEYTATKLGPSVNCLNNVSLALVSVFGALLYLNGGLRLGDLSTFVQYSRKFSGPINEVAEIVGELQSAISAAERVFHLMDQEPEPQDPPQALELTSVKGTVEFRNVQFGYVPEYPILKDFSLKAEPGSVVAIVGPTGAGKTTVINLLMRFYDVQSGEITIDGHNIRDLTRSSLRGAFAMVLQDTWLFSGTIYENLDYGKPGVTRAQVEAAAKAARIHSYISSLPQGYDTVLTDNGTNISKGQKQLLTIARAMLLDAKMLILDEATSNVDTRTEQQIQAAMLTLMRGRTCFVIAHRLSTIRNADQILVVRDGVIVERGTHESLMAQGGEYLSLYNAQFAAC